MTFYTIGYSIVPWPDPKDNHQQEINLLWYAAALWPHPIEIQENEEISDRCFLLFRDDQKEELKLYQEKLREKTEGTTPPIYEIDIDSNVDFNSLPGVRAETVLFNGKQIQYSKVPAIYMGSFQLINISYYSNVLPLKEIFENEFSDVKAAETNHELQPKQPSLTTTANEYHEQYSLNLQIFKQNVSKNGTQWLKEKNLSPIAFYCLVIGYQQSQKIAENIIFWAYIFGVVGGLIASAYKNEIAKFFQSTARFNNLFMAKTAELKQQGILPNFLFPSLA
jgi:hypothetical protein